MSADNHLIKRAALSKAPAVVQQPRLRWLEEIHDLYKITTRSVFVCLSVRTCPVLVFKVATWFLVSFHDFSEYFHGFRGSFIHGFQGIVIFFSRKFHGFQGIVIFFQGSFMAFKVFFLKRLKYVTPHDSMTSEKSL